MLTDRTFFTGNLFIANLNENCDSSYFFEWIEQWEEQCLRITLGDCIYNDLVDNLEWNEDSQKYVIKAGADPKWSQLLYGHDYTKDDISDQSLIYYPNRYLFCGFGCANHNCDTFKWEGIISILDRRIPTTTIGNTTVNGIEIKRSYLAYYIYWAWSLSEDSFTTGTGEQILKVKGAERVSNTPKRIQAYNTFVSYVIHCNSNGKVGLYRYMQDFNNLFPEWEGTLLTYEPVW